MAIDLSANQGVEGMFGSHVSADNSSIPSERVELSDGHNSTIDQIGSPSGTKKPMKTSRRRGNKKRTHTQ